MSLVSMVPVWFSGRSCFQFKLHDWLVTGGKTLGDAAHFHVFAPENTQVAPETETKEVRKWSQIEMR